MMAPNKPQSQSERIADIEGKLPEIEKKLAAILEAQSSAEEERTLLLKMVGDMHDALMKPQPGQRESLLNRMATVTINIESGERIGRILVWLAGVLAAVGGVIAALKWGGPRP